MGMITSQYKGKTNEKMQQAEPKLDRMARHVYKLSGIFYDQVDFDPDWWFTITKVVIKLIDMSEGSE